MIDLNFTLILQLFIVLTLMVILGQVVFKPFLKILQERKDRVEKAEKKARELQQLTSELMVNYRESFAAAQAQEAMILQNIRKEGTNKEVEILQKAMEESNLFIQQMKEKIAEESNVARATLREQSQNLSYEIAEKILGRKLL
jgi:F-type H+-transporting ATPase subunit b